jgi:hypothetical protein
VKAISIQQPWAYCITHATKRVENRTWYGRHRGDLLIHAGKKFQTGMEYDINIDCPEIDIYAMQQSDRGMIVGMCRMVDCVPPGEPQKVADDQVIWSDPYQYKFVLTDVRALLIPVPFKGMLGFFDVPDDLHLGAMTEARK